MENPQGQPDDAGVVQLLKKKKNAFFNPQKCSRPWVAIRCPRRTPENIGFCGFFFPEEKTWTAGNRKPKRLEVKEDEFFFV